jgi:hypothetical protein
MDLKELHTFHRKCAVDLFNQVWDLMEKEHRTPQEELNMIHYAHASRYHWSIVGDEVNFARGEWQVSRVYSIVGSADQSLFHAQTSLAYCLENEIGDFDLAFAYEAMARAYSLTDETKLFREYLEKATSAGEVIEEGDKKVFMESLQDLRRIPTT